MGQIRHSSTSLTEWTRGTWIGEPAVCTGVSMDTRTLKRGHLFVALTGSRADGHAYLREAAEKGAAAALVSSPAALPDDVSLPLLCVDDCRIALLDMARGYRRLCTGTIVAVTGSAGKTTVKDLIYCMLSSAFDAWRSPGNWNNELGMPLSLLNMPAACDVRIMELGMNHPGELSVLCDVLKPNWGVVTNVGPAHIAAFGSVRDIAEEKSVVLHCLGEDGLAFTAVDQEWSDVLLDGVQARVVTTSLSSEGYADYTGFYKEQSVIVEGINLEQEEFPLPMPGIYSARNVLLAVAVANVFGVNADQMREALLYFQPAGYRWEVCECAGVTIVNDAYNANPLSMKAAVQALGEMPCSGARWLVLGKMNELGVSEEAEHRRLGQWLGGQHIRLVTVGETARFIAEGAGEAGLPDVNRLSVSDQREAVDVLIESLSVGDVLMVKGSRSEKLEKLVEALRDVMQAEHQRM